MTKTVNRVIWFYVHLLRLYPPLFRAEFAEEMQAVFALAFNEAKRQSRFVVIRLCLSELYDLPLSLVREHLRERQQRYLLQEVAMPQDRLLLRHYRFYTVTLLLTVILYLLLVILPFFAYGLHLQPAIEVAHGSFDPKDYPLYASGVTFFVITCGYLWLVAAGIILGFTLIRYWRRLPVRQRRFGMIAVFASASLLVFIGTPTVRLILQWLMD